MKKTVSMLLAILLFASLCPAGLAETSTGFYDLPSAVYHPALSQQALTIAETCYTLFPQLLLMAGMGYTKIGDYNMTRPEGDTRHIAAYVLYEQALPDGRTAVVLAVRGTGEGEWPLNMDLIPSGNAETDVAENFYLAAQDILTAQADYFSALQSPVFLVTGHSRGAAVANLIAKELTDRYGAENVYGYTFATPRTVRGDIAAYDNIFNVINPADLVTYLPFPQWGFVRYGQDLILPVESLTDSQRSAVEAAYEKRVDKLGEDIFSLLSPADLEAWTKAMTDLMPDLQDAYTRRHALSHPGDAGEGEPAATGWDLMENLISAMLGGDPQRVRDMLEGFQAADNDFAQACQTILSLMEKSGIGAVASGHVPATYGAYMTLLNP